MMVPFWVLIIIRHLLFRVPQKGAIILTTTHIEARRAGGRCTVVHKAYFQLSPCRGGGLLLRVPVNAQAKS